MTVTADIVVDCVSLCQIISGVYIGNGILKIRAFFMAQKKKECVNT